MTTTTKPDVDQTIINFLETCDTQQVAAMVVYGFTTSNGPVLKLKSNQPEGPTGGILRMLQGLDQNAVLAAAKAIHAELAPLTLWGSLDEERQKLYVQAAFAAINAAKDVSGKLLQTSPAPKPPAA